tara:strand:+ start:87 stop:539 length:453 start_codon:yes stop_codon:yes gene_type:complete
MYFYGIFDKNDDCLYVGKTINPLKRKDNHSGKKVKWKHQIHYYKILDIEDDREMELIREYQTKYNKERYVGGVSKYKVGDIFGHIDKSKNTYKTRPSTRFQSRRIKHKPTGVIYKSGYAVYKAGLCGGYLTSTLSKNPTSPLHDIFEIVD